MAIDANSYANYSQYFVAAKFWVEFRGVYSANFMECSGLQLQTDVFEYSEGGLNSYTHKLPVRTKVGNITLKRGIILDDALWAWYNDVLNGKIVRYPLAINLFEDTVETSKAPRITWQLDNALPVKWSGPSLSAKDGTLAVDTLEFACSAFSRVVSG